MQDNKTNLKAAHITCRVNWRLMGFCRWIWQLQRQKWPEMWENSQGKAPERKCALNWQPAGKGMHLPCLALTLRKMAGLSVARLHLRGLGRLQVPTVTGWPNGAGDASPPGSQTTAFRALRAQGERERETLKPGTPLKKWGAVLCTGMFVEPPRAPGIRTGQRASGEAHTY